jgi:hypothetical protein
MAEQKFSLILRDLKKVGVNIIQYLKSFFRWFVGSRDKSTSPWPPIGNVSTDVTSIPTLPKFRPYCAPAPAYVVVLVLIE